MKLDVRAAAVVAALAVGSVTTAQAQEAPAPYRNVISANPFGLLLEFFNIEYERVLAETFTGGVGGSMFPGDEDADSTDSGNYVNVDVFWRFYPSGRPLDGWAFGAKIGLTRLPSDVTRFGFGFDANRSWLLGKNDNFYVGVGFGLKRLLGVSDEDDSLEFIPTIRLVNIGVAF
jgi:hypothetical protein